VQDLKIILASPRFVVVDKPTGMLSVPGKGPEKQDCAAARVRALFPSATGPLVVHRLDMETSGLLIFGLDEDSQKDLSAQFERRQTDKKYVALLEGQVEREAGEISLPIRLDVDRRPYQIVDPIHGRPAVTHYRVLSHEIDRTRIQFIPLTGRTHQLRVHAAAGLGCPIVGDVLYGDGHGDRLMLHASELSFVDPDTGRRVQVSSPVPF
jgi:tRNA pseudouridine32 synthase/23S rRNA pseudouridine746 synthase